MAPQLDTLLTWSLAASPLAAGLWIAALTLLGVAVLPWARAEALRSLDAWRAVWTRVFPVEAPAMFAFADPMDLLPEPLPGATQLARRRPLALRRDRGHVHARRS